jgi:glucose-1-phosphate cytidylyltransferase
MQTVILCGGLGTRLEGDNPDRIPKPLTSIGGIPMIEHIMNIYSFYGYNEFILCLGYKGNLIKKYFAEYYLNNCDVSINLENDELFYRKNTNNKKFKIELVDTGKYTATGSRLGRVSKYIKENILLFTYGDGLCNLDVNTLIEYHKSHKKLVTITTVPPKGQFGVVEIDNHNQVINFQEKPIDTNTFISAGFFVVNSKIFEYINDLNNCWWESYILPTLAKENQVMAYRHTGEFMALDSPKDKIELENIWNNGNAFWKLNKS